MTIIMTETFMIFMYKEKKSSGGLVDTGLVIAWDYDTEGDYSSKSEIPENAKIKSISLFGILD